MKLAASSVGALIFSVFVLSLSALAADRIEISRDRVTGQATLVLDKSVSTSLPLTATADARTLKGSAGQFLRTHANSFGISDVKASLKAISSSTDHLGISHVKYLQVISGIQVFGGEINVHLNQEGIPYAATGKFVPGTVLDLKPKISKRELRNIVLSEWASEHFGAAAVVGAPSLILFSLENLTGELRLSYRVNATQFSGETVQDSADFVIDALNGKVLKTISHAYDLSRQIYDCNTYPATCYMDVWRSQYQYYFGRSEPYGVRGSHPIPGIFYGSHDVDNLFEYFGQAHSYYQTKFGRDGGNGAGGIGTGRSGETPTAYTRGLVHLDGAWSNCPAGASFTYTGRVQACLGMVTPDILGHEYSHSIPYFTFRDQNNYPVGAVYEGETGALNEAWANLAGEALELQIGGVHNWIIGQSFLSGGVPVLFWRLEWFVPPTSAQPD